MFCKFKQISRSEFLTHFCIPLDYIAGFSSVSEVKICLQCRRLKFNSWVEKIPCRREWQPTAVFLPGKFHEQKNLVGYSPRGHKELDMTGRLTDTHTQTTLHIN